MKFLIKQRAFSWSDTFDIYDEYENKKYFVQEEFLSLGHRLHVYDMNGHEVGLIKEKVLTFLPEFEVMIGRHSCGIIKKKFTFFHPQYELDYNGWHVEGDFLSWNYDVYEACSAVIHITKEPWHWGDTYVIDFLEPKDELMGLMLVLAIDAANCTNN